MALPGRQFNSGEYRFGFNSKENDNEIKGSGNSLDFGARVYDPRSGRWLSVDPQATKYSYFSPYLGLGNNPFCFIDPGGETLRVASGTKASRNRFKAMLEKQFAGNVTVKYGDFGVLEVELVEGAQLSKSQAALFAAVNYKGFTDIGLVSGNEEVEVRYNNEIQTRSAENVMIGASYPHIQIFDLDDLAKFDELGLAEGLGVTTAGSIGHETAEANRVQSDDADKLEYSEAHLYGTEIENIINGTERDERNTNFINRKIENESTSEGKTKEFGTLRIRYNTKDGPKSVNYSYNGENVGDRKPTTQKDDTRESVKIIND